MPGFSIFRYETTHSWKAAVFGDPIESGAIAGCSGQIHFRIISAFMSIPSVWGKVTISLLDPLTTEILNNPVYRKSIDIVGIDDGSVHFPGPSESDGHHPGVGAGMDRKAYRGGFDIGLRISGECRFDA